MLTSIKQTGRDDYSMSDNDFGLHRRGREQRPRTRRNWCVIFINNHMYETGFNPCPHAQEKAFMKHELEGLDDVPAGINS
jgi:hypothetical protein